DALLGQARIAPAGEQVFQIPLALPVADEDQGSGHSRYPCSVVESEYVDHGIKPGGMLSGPEYVTGRAIDKDRAILGAVAQLDAIAGPGQDHRMIAHHRAAAQSGNTVSAGLAWPGMAIADPHRMGLEGNRAPL